MKEDLKLKKVCLITWIVALLILAISITDQVIFNWKKDSLNITVGQKNTIDIIINIFIWVSAGIASGAFILWFTKMFDYAAKKEDVLTDFFFTSFKLMNIINNLKPLRKSDNMKASKESYIEFDNNRYLFTDLMHIYKKIKFKSNDKTEELIKNIIDFYKNIIPKISFILVTFDYANESDYLRQMCTNEFDIFNISRGPVRMYNEPTKKYEDCDVVNYRNKVDIDLLPKMLELEKLLFDEQTLSSKIFTPFVRYEDSYIKDFHLDFKINDDDDSSEG